MPDGQPALLPLITEAFAPLSREFGPTYVNFLRDESPLPPPAPGGDGGTAAGAPLVVIGGTPPASPREGLLWFDTTTWRLFIFVSGAWFYLC